MEAKVFPGTVRVIDPGPKGSPRLRLEKLTDDKGRAKGTRVVVPPGYRLDYELKHAKPTGRKPKKPVAEVKLMKAGARLGAVHAELAHEHDVETVQIVQGKKVEKDDEGKMRKVPNLVEVEVKSVRSVTATSTEHAGPDGAPLVGTGANAAAAVADLRAKIDASLAAAKTAKPSPGAGATGDVEVREG